MNTSGVSPSNIINNNTRVRDISEKAGASTSEDGDSGFLSPLPTDAPTNTSRTEENAVRYKQIKDLPILPTPPPSEVTTSLLPLPIASPKKPLFTRFINLFE